MKGVILLNYCTLSQPLRPKVFLLMLYWLLLLHRLNTYDRLGRRISRLRCAGRKVNVNFNGDFECEESDLAILYSNPTHTQVCKLYVLLIIEIF